MSRGDVKRVVLVGAGHAHLSVARAARRFADLGAELTLVDPGDFWYSGLATGMLGGMYEAEDDRVDARSLIEASGGRFVRDRVVGLDRSARVVQLEGGARLAYEAISFNVGSTVSVPEGLGGAAHVWTVKPISDLWRLRRTLEDRMRNTPPTAGPLSLVVVGGGASGCEVAANLDALARRRGRAIRLTLVTSGPRLLPEGPKAAARRLSRALKARGVRLEFDCRIVQLGEGAARDADGRTFVYDEAILATGLRPPPLVAALDLPGGSDGGLLVDDTLRSVGDDRVFGAGDCITLKGHDLPRLGVYAVREAPVLLHNLLATFTGNAVERYSPQKRCLSILNLDNGKALALWGPFHWLGRLSLRLKDFIDRRFLERYRVSS